MRLRQNLLPSGHIKNKCAHEAGRSTKHYCRAVNGCIRGVISGIPVLTLGHARDGLSDTNNRTTNSETFPNGF
jgi:hypothetical protein